MLDADITLAFAGDQATVLKLDGAWRPPPAIAGAGLDRAVLHQAAIATARNFLGRIPEGVAHPAAAAPGQAAAPAQPGISQPPATGMP